MKPERDPAEEYEAMADEVKRLGEAAGMAAVRKEPEALDEILADMKSAARKMKHLNDKIKAGIPVGEVLAGGGGYVER